MIEQSKVLPALAFFLAIASATALGEGDVKRGASVFRNCAACHSVEPGRHMTGPSLADVWGRRAGTVQNFPRYSEALKNSDVIWNQQSLDNWLKSPKDFVPDNLMFFPGITDSKARQDLIAYLKAVSEGKAPSGAAQQGGMMGGMMGGGQTSQLKEVGPSGQVKAIRYCGDTYHVTTAAGKTFPFWEFNLRFKTDSSANGPVKGQPVLIRAGMTGDRAFIVFSSAEEMSTLIKTQC